MLDVDAVYRIIKESGAEIGEQVTFDAKEAVTSPIPDKLNKNVRDQISIKYPNGLFSHQAFAISKALDGENICVATPTASGKTLIFTSVSVSTLLAKPGSVLVAIYPAKALLHDQVKKWEAAVEKANLTIGIIDGGVDTSLREQILDSNRIILMTPDVLHAWLMARLGEPVIQRFVGALEVVVLDEAHVYDGIFGTNMAYLLRRLQAVCGRVQFLASSATIGDPIGLLKEITGRDFELIGSADDGAAVAKKTIINCHISTRRVSSIFKNLIKEFSINAHGRFLVFADSRKKVEELTADGLHGASQADPNTSGENTSRAEEPIKGTDDIVEEIGTRQVLPYRAGYEEHDRDEIQAALTKGTLRGVVTTSALELGIDIGDVELVVLLGVPISIKSFWQRAGRSGRSTQGFVLILDVDKQVASFGLQRYLGRKPEPNWLYMNNEYLLYANALCAAEEQIQFPETLYSRAPFKTLPPAFVDIIENELQPTRPISDDLYPLKQQAINGPHRAFPVRSGIEKNYHVTSRNLPGQKLGTLSYSQLLREAFPGAIYRYLALPYRVFQIKHHSGEVVCSRTGGYVRTSPIMQTAVFPRFEDQPYYARLSSDAFIIECRLQVSERVVGFVEQRGHARTEIKYGVGNTYAQKPLSRYIETTGVCFYFPDKQLQSDKLAKYVTQAFCRVCSVQERDVGHGIFIAQTSPIGSAQVRGFSIYDSAYGSLRLTHQITDKVEVILEEASRIAAEEGAPNVSTAAKQMLQSLLALSEPKKGSFSVEMLGGNADDEWKTVISSNQIAICHDGESHINEEVVVLRYNFTTQGIRYTLKADKEDVQWQVSARMIRPIAGVTALEQFNIATGEVRATIN